MIKISKWLALVLIIGTMLLISFIILLAKVDFNSFLLFLNNFKTSQLRTTLEIVDYICTPILVLIAIVGLYQLVLAKRTAYDVNKRDTLKSTFEKCLFFATDILEKGNEFEKLINEMNLSAALSPNNIEIRYISKKPVFSLIDNKIVKEKIDDIMRISPLAVDLMNLLEVYAIFVLSGVGDERVAYVSTAQAYLQNVDNCKLFITLSEGDDYRNLFDLYLKWSEKKNNEMKGERLIEIINEMMSRKPNDDDNDNYIRPIGL